MGSHEFHAFPVSQDVRRTRPNPNELLARTWRNINNNEIFISTISTAFMPESFSKEDQRQNGEGRVTNSNALQLRRPISPMKRDSWNSVLILQSFKEITCSNDGGFTGDRKSFRVNSLIPEIVRIGKDTLLFPGSVLTFLLDGRQGLN